MTTSLLLLGIAVAGGAASVPRQDAGTPTTAIGMYDAIASPGPRYVASLTKDGQPCMAVLIDKALFRATRHLKGRRVHLTGEVIPRPAFAADTLVLQVRGRDLPADYCAGVQTILYATQVRAVAR